ncbi:hemolysin family protein [Nocardioides rotundus]|uniref:hemolysin family protein n=1 Tax=Nocardioides rotundus TaxID=1774216 RepID=UPI001CC0D8D3|nr:hemolysin family protein [Nocardioides rotundus]UAL31093.1 hemolysin family protein [Nocardioides rotundus]
MVTATLLLLLGLLVIFAIIAANGYFVAQEFAYMSVDRSRLGARAEAGDPAAKSALAITRRTSFMLSGAQLGITVTGLLVGYVAEPLVGRSLGVLLGGVGVPTAVGIAVGTVLALVISTVVQMIFGELFPKNLAIANPEPLSLFLARSTRIYLAVFGWLITIFDHAANGLLRLLRIEPVEDVDSSATAQDLEYIVEDSRASGDIDEDLSMMLDRILDFPHRDVEHAMRSRSRVDVVRPETTVAELRDLMATGHTRYPVIDEADEAVGVVQLPDLLQTGLPDDVPVERLMREPLVLPTLMPLPAALATMTRSHNELACVIDEFGGFTGILTIEDMAEEVAGEITDEHDPDEPGPVPLEGGSGWELPGDLPLDELERTIGRDLPRGDYETAAGLVIAVRGDLPEVGERLSIALPDDQGELAEDIRIRRELEVEVRELERHVPGVVRVWLRETDEGEQA